MKQVFLDTEFTDFQDARLISLGLVAEDGRSCYVEIERASWWEYRSEFVDEFVVPLLHTDGVPSIEAAGMVKGWIEALKEPVQVVVDYELDWRLLLDLVRLAGEPANLEPYCVPFDLWSLNTLTDVLDFRSDWYAGQGVVAHHALHDARALAAAWVFHSQRSQDLHEGARIDDE